jgi:predicted nucleic acid-binding protein
LLDTSVVVAVLRRVPGILERLRGEEELFVPLVVLG